jgi:hypothetical protein
MTDEQKPEIENLEQQEEELTPEQADAAQGGGGGCAPCPFFLSAGAPPGSQFPERAVPVRK